MTILELGTGALPFERKYPNELVAATAIMSGKRPELPDAFGNLDVELKNRFRTLMKAMWDHEPSRRPSTATVLQNIIEMENQPPRHGFMSSSDTLGSQLEFLSSNLTLDTDPPGPRVASTSHIVPHPPISRTSQDLASQQWVWSTAECATISAHDDHIVSVAYSPTRQEIATGSKDKRIRTWRVNSKGVWVQHKEYKISMITHLAYSADGKQLAVASYTMVRFWNPQTGASIAGQLKHPKFVTCVEYSRDGMLIATGSKDQKVQLWNANTKSQISTPLSGHTGEITSIAFSYDSVQIASASSDKTIRLWNTQSRACLRTLTGHNTKITSVAFSPDNRKVISGGEDKILQRWDLASGQKLSPPLLGHHAGIKCVTFAPSGEQFASSSLDNTILIWEASTGALVGRPLEGHKGTIDSIAFSPDGGRLVSGSRDNTLKIWTANAIVNHNSLRV